MTSYDGVGNIWQALGRGVSGAGVVLQRVGVLRVVGGGRGARPAGLRVVRHSLAGGRGVGRPAAAAAGGPLSITPAR